MEDKEVRVIISGKEEEKLINDFFEMQDENAKEAFYSVYKSIWDNAEIYMDKIHSLQEDGKNPSEGLVAVHNETLKILYCMQEVMKMAIDDSHQLSEGKQA